MNKKLPTIPYATYNKFNKERNICLNLSNELRVLAKTTISFLIKDNIKIAKKNLQAMNKLFKSIQHKIKKNPHLFSVSGINVGLEEYIEAILLFEYISNKTLSSIDKFKVMPEVYLGGLSDMTGELIRIARKHEDQAKEIHDYIVNIYDLLIPVSITRNGTVRTKLEALSSNLRKIEDIIYNLKLRNKI